MRKSKLRSVIIDKHVFLVCLSCTSTARLPAQTNILDRAVETSDGAVMVLPPMLACAPAVTMVKPRADGKFIISVRQEMRVTQQNLQPTIVMRQPPISLTEIVVWSAADRRVRSVWKSTVQNVRIETLEWMPQTDCALALVSESQTVKGADGKVMPVEKYSLLRIPAGDGSAKVLDSGAPTVSTYGQLTVSATEPQAVVVVSRFPENAPPDQRVQQSLLVVDAAGRLFQVPAFVGSRRFMEPVWSSKGELILMYRDIDRERKNMTTVSFKWDAARGMVSVPNPPRAQTDEVKAVTTHKALGVAIATAANAPAGAMSLLLTPTGNASGKRAMITGDGSSGAFLPGDPAIQYLSQGALFVAPLIKLDKATYDVLVEQAERMRLLSAAKQIGLASLMYAQDNDEVLPHAADYATAIDPYLKDNSLMTGFNYSMNGEKLKDIASPAETVLGYFNSKGGRVEVYVDGHAKFRKP